jgi:hypothetical protein
MFIRKILVLHNFWNPASSDHLKGTIFFVTVKKNLFNWILLFYSHKLIDVIKSIIVKLKCRYLQAVGI